MEHVVEWNWGESATSMRLPSSLRFVKFIRGRHHSALLTDKGHILTWGINNFGQLGHGDRKDRSQPTIVESLCDEEIFDFALGSSFTVAITRSGKVYHWGYLCAPKNNLSPQSFSIDGFLPISICAGKVHCLVLMQQGSNSSESKVPLVDLSLPRQVYAIGQNNHGQLGLPQPPFTASVDTLACIQALSDKDIISISSGKQTSAAVSSSGKLYMWGSTLNHVIPRSGASVDIVNEPQKVSVRYKISSIQFGEDFVVAGTTKGMLLSWGSPEFGCLGRSVFHDSVNLPAAIKLKDPVEGYCCGKHFTIAWTADKSVFLWGVLPYKTTELDDISRPFYATPRKIDEFPASISSALDVTCYTSVFLIASDFVDQSIVFEQKTSASGESYLMPTAAVESHIVEALITTELPDGQYDSIFENFLYAFPLVCSSVSLFDQLAHCYEMPDNLHSFPLYRRVQLLSQYRQRIATFLTIWVTSHWERDFACDEALRHEIEDFLTRREKDKRDDILAPFLNRWNQKHGARRHASSSFLSSAYRTSIIKSPQHSVRRAHSTPQTGTTPGSPNSPRRKSPPAAVSFLSVPLETLAKQITIFDCELFKRIKLSELYRQAWSRPNKQELAGHILAVTGQFNRMSHWAVWVIVSCLHFDQRLKLLRRLILLAQELLRLNNYNGAISILSALSNSAVSRLKETWNALGEEHHERLSILRKFSASAKSFAVLREQMKSCDLPAVPFLGMYLSDLTFIEEGNKEKIDEKLNLKRLVQLGATYREIFRFKKSQYPFQEVTEIQHWIRNLRNSPEEELFRMSHTIEPRIGDDPWPVVRKLLDEHHFHIVEIRRLRQKLEAAERRNSKSNPGSDNDMAVI